MNSIAELTNHLGLAWWVEVETSFPTCTHFFGPFLSHQEAEEALPGYVKDLKDEQASGIIRFEIGKTLSVDKSTITC